jgi:DNA-directed RNA polymerase specialized sigma subunit
MALKAAESYDPASGVKLSTYVMSSMRGLNRLAADRKTAVHVPEGALLDQNRIRKSSLEFKADNGRDPSAQEVADATGLSVKRLASLKERKGELRESDSSSDQGDALAAVKGDKDRLWVDFVYHDLDPISKSIFEQSTGYGGAARAHKQEIAKGLGISAAAVSQRIGKITDKLAEGLGDA